MRRLIAVTSVAAAMCFACFVAESTAIAATRSVGPGKTFAAPCAAFAAAADGDTIEIAAGTYTGDVCAITKNRLTIKGVGGRAHVAAGGKSAGGKGIWVIQGSDTVVEDIEFSGCSVPDKNGAGIRQEGRNLTVRHSYFHDNENGILGGADPEGAYLIENSEFARNGAGDGFSHNMYIGEIKSFTLRGSYSHHAKIGHLVKSRALTNHILYNRLTDETGTASYEIDLPQGGPSFIIGNVIQQSAATDNSTVISYARESKRNPDSLLWVVGNTFFNARSAGTFIGVSSTVMAVEVRNNIFAGPGTLCDFPTALKENNFVGDPLFVNTATYDFHLKGGSPAIDKGIAPGTGFRESLAPVCQYVHPANAVVRTTVGGLDQGAYELGGESAIPCGGVLPGDVGPGDAGTADSATGDIGVADTGVADTTIDPSDTAIADSASATDSGLLADSAADGAEAGEGATAGESSGCGCHTTPSQTSPSFLTFLGVVGVVGFIVRRRRLLP